MSRVGKKPIEIPSNVQFTLSNGVAKVKGPKGEMSFQVPSDVDIHNENGTLTFTRANDNKHVRALHGTTRAMINNLIKGVTEGFTKTLNVVGVGFKVEMKGKKLLMSLGFSHPILIIPPDDVEFVVTTPTQFQVKGSNKQIVGEIAAKIRDIRPPEPYKGKGVNYDGEFIRRKAGKSAGK